MYSIPVAGCLLICAQCSLCTNHIIAVSRCLCPTSPLSRASEPELGAGAPEQASFGRSGAGAVFNLNAEAGAMFEDLSGAGAVFNRHDGAGAVFEDFLRGGAGARQSYASWSSEPEPAEKIRCSWSRSRSLMYEA